MSSSMKGMVIFYYFMSINLCSFKVMISVRKNLTAMVFACFYENTTCKFFLLFFLVCLLGFSLPHDPFCQSRSRICKAAVNIIPSWVVHGTKWANSSLWVLLQWCQSTCPCMGSVACLQDVSTSRWPGQPIFRTCFSETDPKLHMVIMCACMIGLGDTEKRLCNVS